MTKTIVLYWEPGSCGEFIQSALLSDTEKYTGVVDYFNLTAEGRVSSKINDQFQVLTHDKNFWYARNWAIDDFEYIEKITPKNKTLVIPTHRYDQLQNIKRALPDCITVGICYPENLYYLVLKNWCKKVAFADHQLHVIYNTPVHNKLKSKGCFGEFILKEQLRFGSKIRKSVDNDFDIRISLEELYSGNFSIFPKLLTSINNFDSQYNNWIFFQNKLFQFNYDYLHDYLKLALGYNSKATKQGDINLKIDLFDNILIQHICKNHNITATHFLSLRDADIFFREHFYAN
jgi:hypothetical protein